MRNADREEAWNAANRRVGEWVETLGGGRQLPGLEGGVLDSISVRVPTEDRPEAFVVLKAHVGTDKFVAFVGALTVHQAFLTWRAKVAAGGLKWREDVPYGER